MKHTERHIRNLGQSEALLTSYHYRIRKAVAKVAKVILIIIGAIAGLTIGWIVKQVFRGVGWIISILTVLGIIYWLMMHLVGGIVLDVPHNRGVEPVLPDGAFEHGLLKAVGMFAFIFVEKLADRHALAGKPGHIARYQCVQLQLALRRLAVTELRASEHLPEMFFRELKQLFGSLAA